MFTAICFFCVMVEWGGGDGGGREGRGKPDCEDALGKKWA